MLKHVSQFAKLAVVSSTLLVLGATAVVPAAHALNTGITQNMINYCQSHGFTNGVTIGYTPGSQFNSQGQLVPGTGQFGYFCANKNSNAYIMIPSSAY